MKDIKKFDIVEDGHLDVDVLQYMKEIVDHGDIVGFVGFAIDKEGRARTMIEAQPIVVIALIEELKQVVKLALGDAGNDTIQ